ncbi:MAG: hypothetical protein JST50_20610 [Bacteroidetes bacterium]|jgi:hypothetical protein|nr:hypothetical protein [Bacteroidota bacterium]
MEKLIKGIMILCMVSLFGCTRVLYTQDEVLGRYKTRNDVQKTFGIPTEKQVSDTSERWLYRYDRHNSFSDHSVELHHNIQTVTVNDFSKYDRYLLFSFDRNCNVVRCDYTGVDLTVKKQDTGATIGLVVGCTAALLLIAVGVSHMSFGINGY